MDYLALTVRTMEDLLMLMLKEWLDLARNLQNIRSLRQIKLDLKLQQARCALTATAFGC